MLQDADDMIHAPWHEGEVRLQKRYGAAERMAAIGSKIIRPFMPLQHREFFSQLPFLVAGTVDQHDDSWVSLVAGIPGFISSPTDRRLDVAIGVDPQDPVSHGVKEGEAIGLLGVELNTRRRNRMNGTIANLKESGFSIDVRQSFGNCPRYIQHRDYEFTRNPREFTSAAAQELSGADPLIIDVISKADTFFVSSYVDLGDGRQIDVSHRGGKSGFVNMAKDGTLTIPDYSGNLFFNTLGNFIKNPKAGLVFPDFEKGNLLQLTGDAEVILASPEIDFFEGAERIWKFRPRKAIFREGALPMRWVLNEFSPHSLTTGSWEDVELQMQSLRGESTIVRP